MARAMGFSIFRNNSDIRHNAKINYGSVFAMI